MRRGYGNARAVKLLSHNIIHRARVRHRGYADVLRAERLRRGWLCRGARYADRCAYKAGRKHSGYKLSGYGRRNALLVVVYRNRGVVVHVVRIGLNVVLMRQLGLRVGLFLRAQSVRGRYLN
mgnify:CR=1 FL=1